MKADSTLLLLERHVLQQLMTFYCLPGAMNLESNSEK